MAIKNLMEDIVASTVREILKKESEVSGNKQNEEDIIAYVLNRVPPRYFTSERGVIHGKLESRYEFQQRTDILFLTHEAIGVIRKRRVSSSHAIYGEVEREGRMLPHIMGEVLEETTFSVIPDMEVLLLYKNKPAEMVDKSWKNPLTTNRAIKGYYHFWPRYLPDEMDGAGDISFRIEFSSPKFKKKHVDFTVRAVDNISLYESKVIPISLLQVKEGVDISFLYE